MTIMLIIIITQSYTSEIMNNNQNNNCNKNQKKRRSRKADILMSPYIACVCRGGAGGQEARELQVGRTRQRWPCSETSDPCSVPDCGQTSREAPASSQRRQGLSHSSIAQACGHSSIAQACAPRLRPRHVAVKQKIAETPPRFIAWLRPAPARLRYTATPRD